MINKKLIKCLGYKNFIEILDSLYSPKPKRFNEISESIEHPLNRQISENLKLMIEFKLIKKQTYSSQHSQYTITPKGKTLIETIRTIK